MGRTKQDKSEQGTPRWHYVVGAVVAVGGLAWTVIAHFVDRPPPATPTIQGDHNVVAGRDINGSHIEMNTTNEASREDAGTP
jgi:hypothetical protein